MGFVLAVPFLPAASNSTPPRALLLDGTLVGNDIIAVGERGTIVRSTDNARTWQPSVAPTRATLTGISFATLTAPRLGWAVGHDAIILATTDAGRTWVKQYQGENLQDSFLDVLALDAQRVIAVGAYGLCALTTNGGKNWTRRKLNDDDYHFNRITRGPSGTLYIAGEHGTLLRSTDQGSTWQPMAKSYEGSFYGVLPLDRRTLLAHGLRGHVYRSTDDGESWQQIQTPQPVLLATAVRQRNGVHAIALAGHAGALLVSRDHGQTFAPSSDPPANAVAELIELPDGSFLALGEAGATLLEVGRVIPNAPSQEPRTR